MIPTQKSRRGQWQTLYDVTTGKKKLLLFVEQGASGIGESTVIEPVQIGIIIKHELPPEKTRQFRRTLCFAGMVRDLGRNWKIWTQKASIVTTIVARYFCEKAPFANLRKTRKQL